MNSVQAYVEACLPVFKEKYNLIKVRPIMDHFEIFFLLSAEPEEIGSLLRIGLLRV